MPTTNSRALTSPQEPFKEKEIQIKRIIAQLHEGIAEAKRRLEVYSSDKFTINHLTQKIADSYFIIHCVAMQYPTHFPEHKESPSDDTPSCPLCNSPMTYRKGKYGFFWGCSTYPKCNGLIKPKEHVP